MRFQFTRDPGEFATHVEAFLAARLERNVIATVLLNATGGRYRGSGEFYVYGVDDAGDVAYAGLRTPPWPMLTSELDPTLGLELMRRWLSDDPDVDGVNGVPSTARAIASAWSELTGGTTRLRMSEAMHVLESVVDPPRPASGRLRVATAADRELMIAWLVAFEEEAGVGRDPSRRAAAIDAALASGALLVWEDGAPVCMVGVSPRVAGAVRVGPVYTPPEQRARGYASSAVAAASRRALGQGADQCMLFTDLANPTSNKIYADVGYRRFGEWEEHLFERA